MTTHRRKAPSSSGGTSSATSRQSTTMRPYHALLPTLQEASFFAAYPATLLLGSLFSYLSPSLRPPTNESTYSPVHQSYQPPHLAPSYFATKRNVFNVYFVKQGWAWVTIAVLGFSFLAARGRHAIALPFDRYSFAARRLSDYKDATEQREERDRRIRRLWQVVLRWALATVAWLLVTQWFFGPSITDRIYILSGGACRRALTKEYAATVTGDKTTEVIAGALSGAACRIAGGIMMGGYDVSGHVFLLVIGSGMLWFEVLPVIFPAARGLTGLRAVETGLAKTLPLEEAPEGSVYRSGPYAERIAQQASVNGARYNTRSKAREEEEKQEAYSGPWTIAKSWATILAVGVAVLSWWMLLMTSAFFHTWSEKALALILAAGCLWSIYIAPRAVPLLRSIIGLPGL